MRGRGIAGGAGLLVLVVTIALMVLLGVRVLDSVTGGGSDEGERRSVAGARMPTSPSAEPGVAAARPAGRDDAAALACEVDHRTLATAVEAYLVLHAAPPVDQAALVDAGFLSEPVAGHTLVVEGGTARVEPTEECAP